LAPGSPLRRGHLYWARLDKRRPVLVVSPDYRNERAGDVIVVPCSTVVRIAPTHVTLRRGEGGIPARSVLKCEQITTLPVDEVGTEALGGRLSAKRMAEAERAILRAIGLPVPELP
jgi:mRNA-degrading endonuclease toxin of MazEF toxin-antitoxin module